MSATTEGRLYRVGTVAADDGAPTLMLQFDEVSVDEGEVQATADPNGMPITMRVEGADEPVDATFFPVPEPGEVTMLEESDNLVSVEMESDDDVEGHAFGSAYLDTADRAMYGYVLLSPAAVERIETGRINRPKRRGH